MDIAIWKPLSAIFVELCDETQAMGRDSAKHIAECDPVRFPEAERSR